MVSCAALGRSQRQEDCPSHTYLPQRPECLFSGSVFFPSQTCKVPVSVSDATRNSEDKETAVLTDCRHKCVNLGKFFKKKKWLPWYIFSTLPWDLGWSPCRHQKQRVVLQWQSGQGTQCQRTMGCWDTMHHRDRKG